MTNQVPPHPVRKNSYTVGRSYDTMSGRVVTMTTRTDNSDVTVTTMNTETGVIGGGPLITIREVKTPTSPCEPVPSVCGIIICETGGRMARTLDLGGSVVSVMAPQSPLLPPKSPLDELNLSSAPGRKSPSPVRVVC